MKEVYVNMNDGSRIRLLQTADDVDVDRWAAARLEALRPIGAVGISCEEHAERLLRRIDDLLLESA